MKRLVFIVVFILMLITVSATPSIAKGNPLYTFMSGNVISEETKTNENPNEIRTYIANFKDLKRGESGYTETLELVKRGIVTGYGDNSFKPFNRISRQHVAVLLYRALELDAPRNITKTLSSTSDVSGKHEYAKEIAAVIDAGVFRGSNGKFNPDNYITRGQMATVLARAFNLRDNNKRVDLADLNKIDQSHRENVKLLAQHNITVGKLNKKGQRYFDAEGQLNRVQFAIFLHRALEVSDSNQKRRDIEVDETYASQVIQLTNAEREKQGLKRLKTDTKLNTVAQDKSIDIVKNDYFDHHSPTYGSLADMLKLYNVTYSSAGENLAIGYSTPEDVVTGWMNSPNHRKNILNEKFTHIGVGHVKSKRVSTQIFIGK